MSAAGHITASGYGQKLELGEEIPVPYVSFCLNIYRAQALAAARIYREVLDILCDPACLCSQIFLAQPQEAVLCPSLSVRSAWHDARSDLKEHSCSCGPGCSWVQAFSLSCFPVTEGCLRAASRRPLPTAELLAQTASAGCAQRALVNRPDQCSLAAAPHWIVPRFWI